MREHDYTTLFKLEHMLKDLRLCLDEAEAVGQRMSYAEQTTELFAEADAGGYGEADFAAVLSAMEERTGTRLDR